MLALPVLQYARVAYDLLGGLFAVARLGLGFRLVVICRRFRIVPRSRRGMGSVLDFHGNGVFWLFGEFLVPPLEVVGSRFRVRSVREDVGQFGDVVAHSLEMVMDALFDYFPDLFSLSLEFLSGVFFVVVLG